jgi:uncharacterized repeat protein (TIGR03803 family)
MQVIRNGMMIGVFLAVPLFASDASAAKMTVLHSFCAKDGCPDGGLPMSEPLIDSAGTLYGTTILGGAHGGGTVYQLRFHAGTGKWKLRTLYGFCAKAQCMDGIDPASSLIADVNGNLYGTTVAGEEMKETALCSS